jgi:hypothetical protein
MSAHALLSPSAAHRWMHCTPAARLEAQLPASTSAYAQEGTLAHSVCELYARKKFQPMSKRTFNASLKKLQADPLWDDEMLGTADAYAEHLAERAMEFGQMPYVAVEARVGISDYVPDAYGTCDCVMIGGDTLIITDYKHGKGVPVSAEGNPQMMLYALGAYAKYRAIYGDSIKRVAMCIDQPRLGSYGRFDLTVDELLAWGENEVKPKAALAHAGMGEFAPGDWCRFCRAKAQCRARAGAHTALEDFKDAQLPTAENVAQVERDGMDGMPISPLLTYAEIGDLLHRCKTLLDWHKSLEDFALAAILGGDAVPGWKAVEGTSNRAWTNQDEALSVIERAGIDKAIVYDYKPKTLAQLEKVIGKAQFEKIAGMYVHKPRGNPVLKPESDPRPPYSGAAADFGAAAT